VSEPIRPADLITDSHDGRLVTVFPSKAGCSGWPGHLRRASEWPDLIAEGFYEFDYYLETVSGWKVPLWDDDSIEEAA